MSATVGLPSSVVIRDLMLTLWFNRWRIFLITIGAMAIATYVALQVQPKYQSNSSMLVLLGPEYGSRPVAGQQLTGAINVLPQELLHTESDILASRDLHRSVIEREAHLVATQDQLDAERTEINRIDLREGHQVADTESDRSTMAARRWADASPHNGEAQ